MLENKFIVIVPVYNSEKYIEKCLNSILSQKYKNYDLVVVNDGSIDNTEHIVNKLRYTNSYKFNICNIKENTGSPLYSFKTGVEFILTNPKDILVTVDGDDYLYDNNVLDYLNFIYQDTNIWMTYGQYVPLSGKYSNLCKPIDNFREYRKSGKWCTSHLRTLKKFIWDKIKIEDLLDGDGNITKYGGDASYMYPALEMCGSKHTKFIDKVLYVYNDLNPNNQMKICSGKDLEVGKKLRSMSMYKELDDNSL